jgi:hypothetical protein
MKDAVVKHAVSAADAAIHRVEEDDVPGDARASYIALLTALSAKGARNPPAGSISA